MELTQKRLKLLLDYDSETGIFTRRISIRGGGKAGDIAGYKNPDGYTRIMIDSKNYQAHRLAWLYTYGEWPEKQIDHINRVKDDNRICNLREYISWENVELTQERLKALLDYDEKTGLFTWKTSIRGGKVGDIAGRKTSDGYIVIRIDGKCYYAHRLIWLYIHGKWPKYELDHINRDKSDNRVENLREYISWENVELTQKRLKKLLHYNEETGIFTWKINTANKVKAGDIAGSLNPKGYIRIRIDGKDYQAHRLAWFYVYGKWPEKQIDHINRIRDDNRICNLRDISNRDNLRNVDISSNNTSGIKGICWHKAKNKWQARIKIDGKTKYLGSYDDKLSAAKARYSAELKYNWQKHETFTSSAKQYIDKYEKLSMKIQKNIRKNILKNGYNSFQI